MDTTTITIDLKVKKMLDKLKLANRESYNDVLARILPKASSNVNVESLQETVEILSDSEAMVSIAKSIEDIRKGRLYDIDEV